MRKSDLLFSFILVPVDFLMIVLSGLIAYFLRFRTLVELRPVIYEIPLKQFLFNLVVIGIIWLIIFALAGLYSIKPRRKWTEEFSKVFLACSTGIMLIIIAVFLKREFFSSRFIVLAGWVLTIIFVSFGRLIVRLIRRSLFKKGIGIHRIVLIGNNNIAEEIDRFLSKNLAFGYRIVERIKNLEEINTDLLEKIFQKHNKEIDEVISADPNIERKKNLIILDFCNEHHLVFRYAADLFDAKASNIKTDTLSGVPIVEIRRTPLDGWGRIFKRVIDIIGSLIGLILFSPLFLIMPLIIKLDSEGPAIVALKRVGEKGKIFKLYKFRSMVKNAELLKKELMKYNERKGPLFKIKNDPRITRVGRFIRKTSIDEIPQLWNVLKGEMSLVGPRPHEPEEVALYERGYKKLLSIKPGITGMAQVSGRAELSFEDEAKLDSYYIENWSPQLDLQIILKTPFVVLSRRGAV